MQHPPKNQTAQKSYRFFVCILLFVLALAAVAVFVWGIPSIRKQHKQSHFSLEIPENPVRQLSEKNPETIVAIAMKTYGGEQYILTARNGQLMLNQNEQLLPISQEASNELLEIFSLFTVQATIADHSYELPLEEMGLSPAQASATVSYSDGSEILVELGETIPETSYVYMRWSQDDGIYAADQGMFEAFEKNADRLLPLIQPAIADSLVNRVEIQNHYGNVSIRMETDGEGIRSGWFVKPYAYPVGNESLSALLNALASFRLGSVQSNINDKNSSEFGFNPCLCKLIVHQEEGFRADTDENGALILTPQEAIQYTIEIGNETNEHFYYCRFQGCYYLVSKYLIQTFLSFSAEEAVTTQPMNIGDSSVSKIILQTDNERRELTAKYTETASQEDQKTDIGYSAEYQLNGSSISQAQMDNIIDTLNHITVSGNISNEWTPQGKAIWTLSIVSWSGNERKIEGYRNNPFTDVFSIDGVFLHTLSSETIDILLDILSVNFH